MELYRKCYDIYVFIFRGVYFFLDFSKEITCIFKERVVQRYFGQVIEFLDGSIDKGRVIV